ncbi:MAG: hypothetical protein MK135_16525, partial [Polyangiaceae bacterium]|nr:hypothetical protein [Polyangiaceae bacterium]
MSALVVVACGSTAVAPPPTDASKAVAAELAECKEKAAAQEAKAQEPLPPAVVIGAAEPLPDEALKKAVEEAYLRYRDVQEGKNADYIPILTETPSELFGVAI